MMNEIGEVDLVHIRRLADSASTASGRLGVAGELILSVLSVLEITAEFSGDLATDYGGAVERMHQRLEELWGQLWDAANVPRRPLPRLAAPTRH